MFTHNVLLFIESESSSSVLQVKEQKIKALLRENENLQLILHSKTGKIAILLNVSPH